MANAGLVGDRADRPARHRDNRNERATRIDTGVNFHDADEVDADPEREGVVIVIAAAMIVASLPTSLKNSEGTSSECDICAGLAIGSTTGIGATAACMVAAEPSIRREVLMPLFHSIIFCGIICLCALTTGPLRHGSESGCRQLALYLLAAVNLLDLSTWPQQRSGRSYSCSRRSRASRSAFSRRGISCSSSRS